ncbi:NADPH reductase [Nadsonia fulvescens var. elongata DSM 6958]|uniref:NADPH-dependent diflavin oxidoreductase 1 n=1 Tax=Nadsonia fulvescens var. elongata DSM 6958 TaxID=857566 RepID=A0A1E3PHN8_9ASCO|nr:NADPH reductase [Nadsonia fulvescens var. elongata DSM 6958]
MAEEIDFNKLSITDEVVYDSSLAESRPLLILYGTETGNAYDYALLLAATCSRLHFKVRILSMDDYFLTSLNKLTTEKCIIFITSTLGQGDLPNNCLRFWKFMRRRSLASNLLASTYFTTFGLGDSSYPHYNYAVKKLHIRLTQLGCQEFSPRAEGDEQSPDGVDAMFVEWEKTVRKNLLNLFPLPPGIKAISEQILLPPRNPIKLLENEIIPTVGKSDITLSRSDKTMPVLTGRVLLNNRITDKSHFQDVRNLRFELVDEGSDSVKAPAYSPGDTIALYPSNTDMDVDALIQHQGWADLADTRVAIEGDITGAPGGLVTTLTVRSLIKYHLDIMSIPRRSFFSQIWHFASDERERERLQEFSTLEGLEDLYDYANRPRRSILEVITEFSSLRIPLEFLFSLIPFLRPRLYSIASPEHTDSTTPVSLELVIAIVKYKTIIRRIRRGITTNWISTLANNDLIPFTIHKTTLPVPKDHSVPLVMVAPGTGIAPMRSLILTRHQEDKLHPTEKGSLTLFFGCRFKDKDYLFSDEWPRVHGLTVLESFSRDPILRTENELPSHTKYVQDSMYRYRDILVQKLVHENGVFYICGSAGKMPREVRITLIESIKEVLDWDDEKVGVWLKDMEKKNRYLQEVW